MDRYVYIKSDESDRYFSENQVYKFKVHLKVPLVFSGFWKVGLIEFHAKMTKSRITNQSSAIYICSNICKCSIVDGVEKPLLRRLEPNDITSCNYIFETPLYLSLNKKELIEFEIYILTEYESHASFIDSPLFLTLHFKQYPFHMDF